MTPHFFPLQQWPGTPACHGAADHAGGQAAETEMLVALARGEAAAGGGMVARLADMVITARAEARAARAAQVEADRRFHATFAQAPVGIAHVSPDGRFLLVNEQFARITGHSAADLRRHGFQQITHPDDLESDLSHVRRLLAGEADRYVMEKRYVRPDGTLVWVNLTVALIRDVAGEPDFFVSVIEDVSEMRRAHEEAMRDPLTGLLNRRGFVERAARDIGRAAKSGKALCLAYLDLDGFKRVNDLHGHPRGDACLVEVARLVEAKTRPGDAVARLGGDEFVMLMPHLDAGDAGAVMERIRLALLALGTDNGWPISGSFGVVAARPATGTTPEELIARADAAMFRAKHDGKNCVRMAA